MKTTSKTDWARLDSMKDEEIDTSDSPEWDAAMFANARLLLPEPQKTISIRLENDLIEWYKSLGKGYQTRMKAVLRLYMNAKKQENEHGKGPNKIVNQ
jgi:uncharacterized protein (DUF4415 family)